jgi:hypothetical protein
MIFSLLNYDSVNQLVLVEMYFKFGLSNLNGFINMMEVSRFVAVFTWINCLIISNGERTLMNGIIWQKNIYIIC